jgi:hypothetical protein
VLIASCLDEKAVPWELGNVNFRWDGRGEVGCTVKAQRREREQEKNVRGREKAKEARERERERDGGTREKETEGQERKGDE